MSDEVKAGIVSGIFLGALAVFLAAPSVTTVLLLISTVIVEIMYCKYDLRTEQLRKREKRERDLASRNLHRELNRPVDPQTELSRRSDEIYRRIIGDLS